MKSMFQQNRDTGHLKSDNTEEKTSVCFYVRAWVIIYAKSRTRSLPPTVYWLQIKHNRIMFYRAASDDGENKCCHKNFPDSRTVILDLYHQIFKSSHNYLWQLYKELGFPQTFLFLVSRSGILEMSYTERKNGRIWKSKPMAESDKIVMC
jgi:hypothetical protein